MKHNIKIINAEPNKHDDTLYDITIKYGRHKYLLRVDSSPIRFCLFHLCELKRGCMMHKICDDNIENIIESIMKKGNK